MAVCALRTACAKSLTDPTELSRGAQLWSSVFVLVAFYLNILFQQTLIHIWSQHIIVAMVTGLKRSQRHNPVINSTYAPNTQGGGDSRWLCQCLLSLSYCLYTCMTAELTIKRDITQISKIWQDKSRNIPWNAVDILKYPPADSCTDSPTAVPNSVCALYRSLRRRRETVRWVGLDQTGSDITVKSPSPHTSIRSSCLCLCLCSWSSAREEIRASAAVCGDQPAISACHLGTVCPLGCFPRSQHADNGEDRKCCCGQGTWVMCIKENRPNGEFIWGREPHWQRQRI